MSVQIITDEKVNETRAKMVLALAKALHQADQKGSPIADKDLLNSPQVKNFLQEVLKSPFGVAALDNSNCETEVKHQLSQARKAAFNSPEVKTFFKHPSGTSKVFELGTLFGNRSKAAADYIAKTAGLVGASTLESTLALEIPQEIYELPTRPIRMRDRMRVIATMKALITFAQQTGFTNAASGVQLNPDPATAVALPQSQITVTAQSAPIINIGHHIPVPTQVIDDIEQSQDLFDSQMTAGVLDVEDAQILNGTASAGPTPTLHGLQTEAGHQTFLWSNGDLGDNQADALLNAIAQSWVAYYQPDTIVLHPTNLAQILKLKDLQRAYLFPVAHNEISMADIRKTFYLWGLPIVATVGETLGTALVSALNMCTALWDRQEASMFFAYQNADWITKNLVAVVVQERVAQTIFRPESNVVVTLDSAPV